MQNCRWWQFVAMIGMVVLVGMGCAPAAPDDAPVQHVQQVVAAWEVGDTEAILAAIEPTEWRREISPEIRQYTGLIRQLTFVEPQYTLLDNDGTVAHVRVESRVVYELQDGRSGEQSLRLIVETVHYDGAWYIRGIDTSGSSGY